MSAHVDLAERCHAGADDGSLAFPEIVATLAAAGFDGYAVDFRRNATTYFAPDGPIDVAGDGAALTVAPAFDGDAVRTAIAEAQAAGEDYTYRSFCEQVTSAGCAGYLVSIIGRRVVYLGRTGETHTEYFPS